MAQTEATTPEYKYKAVADFDYYGSDHDLLMVPRTVTVLADRLNDVADGFWINKELKLTKCSDCMFYVMPHHIKSIEKVAVYPDKNL